jgi:O-antigen/teichoic acid export membrane protein
VRLRAKSGVFFVGSLGAVNLVVGFAGSIVLARMLVPADFGVVAIGTTLIMVSTSLADGGLASGLIRREKRASPGELRAALALQLALTSALAGIAATVGIVVGGSGLVVALMMAGLPVSALQTPGRILLSRELRFRVLATVEAGGMLGYYVWAVAGVSAGLGVWALASAVLVRAVISACGVMAASRLGLLGPSFREIGALRPVIAFGLRFQAVSFAGMGREQGLNAGIAAISGVSTLGFWTLTRRLLELPVLMFEPLHRVSFPYLSRMRAAGRDPSQLLDRGVAVAGTASGFVLVAGAAAAPELVPAIFGEQWRPVVPIFQWVCMALLVAGPLAVMAVGFLYSVDAPSAVLRATVAHALVLFAVAFPLLPVLGPEAIGIGSFAGAVTDAWLMSRAVSSRCAASPLKALWPTLAVAAPATAVGLAVTAAAPAGLIGAAAGGLAAAGCYVALLAVARRSTLVETATLIADAVRSAVTRESSLASTQELGQRDTVAAATSS